MKVLFAVSDGTISETIIKKYQSMYKEIIIGKNVYYFNAIIKELQKNKNYDRIVISEDLEPFTSNNFETIDNFLFEKLDSISDEATTYSGEDIPIILITTDRRSKTDNILIRLFGIGVYSALIGQDRSIEEICKLIEKPRSKKDAKKYYRIESSEVEYKPENEGNVSEIEIQNILTYFKRLGRNEDRYVESFDSVAAQYTEQQLRVIIKFLPTNVKKVLKEKSPKYQELISLENPNMANNGQVKGKKRKNKSKNANSGITISSIKSESNKLTKPVIIPSAYSRKKVKEDLDEVIIQETLSKTKVEEPITENLNNEKQKGDEKAMESEAPKRKRGRPRKVQPSEIQNEEKATEVAPKRKRGRPRKQPIVEENKKTESNEIDELLEFDNFEEKNIKLPEFEEKEDETSRKIDKEEYNDFLNFDDFGDEEKTVGNNYEEDDEDIMPLPGLEDDETEEDYDIDIDDYKEENEAEEAKNEDEFEENDYDATLPGFGIEEDDEDLDILPGFEEETPEEQEKEEASSKNSYEQFEDKTDLQSYESKPATIEKLLTNNQKVVAFVGTTKNGTSFLVNNIAEMHSNQGIKTAILDLTRNKNSYYIYTKNEEALRKTAFECMGKLAEGVAQGIKVNSNLDVYTSLPGEDNSQNYSAILETLVQNYSLILLDCDFKTNYEYLNEAQEIYLVQSMDVLTIQPLTAYLRELKAKGVLKQNKLKAVINKYTKVRGISERAIIGGMAFYNDPAMAYMTELFNRETIPYCTIPFDSQVYAKYLEALINCNISMNGYSKDFINNLRKLANMVYPLIGTGKPNKKERYKNPKYNKFASDTFSKDVNSTLDKMRQNY